MHNKLIDIEIIPTEEYKKISKSFIINYAFIVQFLAIV